MSKVRRYIELEFAPCDVCGKDGRPGHDCDNGQALRKAARELFGPTLDLIEPLLVKAGTGILRGVFEVAFERDALRNVIVEFLEQTDTSTTQPLTPRALQDVIDIYRDRFSAVIKARK